MPGRANAVGFIPAGIVTILFIRNEFMFHSIFVFVIGRVLRIALKVSSFMLAYISSSPDWISLSAA